VKMWIARSMSDSSSWCKVFADEPDWKPLAKFAPYYWVSKCGSAFACNRALRKLGFLPLPKGAELCEFDLGGKKPKHLCTWLPEDA
jgi:hypothetical protein